MCVPVQCLLQTWKNFSEQTFQTISCLIWMPLQLWLSVLSLGVGECLESFFLFGGFFLGFGDIGDNESHFLGRYTGGTQESNQLSHWSTKVVELFLSLALGINGGLGGTMRIVGSNHIEQSQQTKDRTTPPHAIRWTSVDGQWWQSVVQLHVPCNAATKSNHCINLFALAAFCRLVFCRFACDAFEVMCALIQTCRWFKLVNSSLLLLICSSLMRVQS